MKYSVDPSALGSMLAVPGVVAEKHLKLASGDQLKVLLAFFKYSEFDDYIEKITSASGLRSAVVLDCLDYWVSSGILLCDGKSNAQSAEQEIPKKKPANTVSGKPTREETVRRAAGDGALKFLFSEIQRKLSKEITAAQMSTLVWLHDTYGLPVEVILMAVEYSISQGKTNFSYIEKVCVDWAENDVTNLVSAENRINQLYLSQSAWAIVRSAFGLPERKATAKEAKLADKWVLEYGYKKDMLKCAYDICVDAIGKMTFPYIDTILTRWHNSGISTPSEAENAKNANNAKDRRKTSYNIDGINGRNNDFDNIEW